MMSRSRLFLSGSVSTGAPPPLQRPVSSSRQPAGTVNLHPSGWGNFRPAKWGIFNRRDWGFDNQFLAYASMGSGFEIFLRTRSMSASAIYRLSRWQESRIFLGLIQRELESKPFGLVNLISWVSAAGKARLSSPIASSEIDARS
jgi:hypothetical protein